MQKKTELQINAEERMKFVNYWAEYVRTHSDKDWGKQQAVLIDSQLANKYPLTREQYLEIKQNSKKIVNIFQSIQ